MQIKTIVRKCISTFKKLIQKVLFKIKLRKMDYRWELMGGRCWELFPPSFYYTHTEEEIEKITNEAIEELEKMIDEFRQ